MKKPRYRYNYWCHRWLLVHDHFASLYHLAGSSVPRYL